ncbi:MAG: 30S ribosomal protein S20, partial [Planctomycetota bacterium]
KRVRQTAKRRSLNNWRKRCIKTQTRAFLQAVSDQDVSKAETEFRKACGLLDRIGCTSTMHRNTVARRKSRLNRQLYELKQRAAGA